MNAKRFFIAVFTILIYTVTVCSQVNEASEKEEIKQILNDYALAVDSGDFEKLTTFWAHEPYVAHVSLTEQFLYGWEAIKTVIKENFETSINDQQYNQKSMTSDFNITIHNNIAYVDYRIDVSGVNDGIEFIGEFLSFTILEKINGSWKIVFRGSPEEKFSYPNNPDFSQSEFELNNVGYNFLEAGNISEAIEVFKLNVRLYPKSFNVYDSLGEAYMKNGNDELAIENYKKSLEKNPNNNNAIKMLKKTE